MEIRQAGSHPSAKGPSDWFTGNVGIDPLFQAPDPAFVSGASVTLEPGAPPHGIYIRLEVMVRRFDSRQTTEQLCFCRRAR